MKPAIQTAFAVLFLTAQFGGAQEAVRIGKGAYAAFPPPGLVKDKGVDKIAEFENAPVYLVKKDGRPIPSNQWFVRLLNDPFGRAIWTYPWRLDTGDTGVEVNYPKRWEPSGSDPMTDSPLLLGGEDFQAVDARAKDWSDWLVSFRMGQSPEKFFDVTVGQGMPYVWIEYHGVHPTLTFGAKTSVGISKPGAARLAKQGRRLAPGSIRFFDVEGKAMTLPATGDTLGIGFGGRAYGLFAPDGTKFQMEADTLSIRFSGKDSYLVLCPLPAPKDLEYFHRYAFAIPRDTKLTWDYNPDAGALTTTWKVSTEPLKGSETRIIQGWIPHHYRTATTSVAFNQMEYLTGRGKMRMSLGNEFSFTYPFNGILPNLPAPPPGGAFDAGRLRSMLALMADKPKFADDTYWCGKDLVRFAQAAFIAQQTKNSAGKTIQNALRAELVNWFTYQPGKMNHLFAYYPKHKALVGFNPSYGSETFSDNHFHYGYYAFATGMLAMQDPQFAADYGPMARLVAKQYANWERDDKQFPFLRTFDIWAGHSWASGGGSQTGCNQESSSEAVQSWSGLILLGQALGDKDMVAAGVMGYVSETQATMEYWFNAHGDVFPPEWKHPIAGMIWSAGKVWGTWFSGSPSWIYGIQWVPSSPAASYLARDPVFARNAFETMLRENSGQPGHASAITDFEGDLCSYMLGYVMMFDPQLAVTQFEDVWNTQGAKAAANPWLANAYYMAHSMKTLGLVDWKCHGDSATSMVFLNDSTQTRTYVAWNPLTKPQNVRFYEGDKLLGQMIAGPQSLASATRLNPASR